MGINLMKKYKSYLLIACLCFTFLAVKAAKKNDIEKLQSSLLNKKTTAADLDFPSHDPSITKGEGIYLQNCAQCHGTKPTYPDKKYMRTRSPKEQYLTVTMGNKKGMPAFKDKLSREERWDALMYMRAEILGYYPENSDELAKMNSIFGGNCAVCHGTRGHGDGPLHKSLYPPPANFNQFSRLYTRTDEKLHHELTYGIPWTAMPAWKGRVDFDQHYEFNDEMIWKLVRYVRQFGYTQSIDRLDRGRENLIEYEKSISKK
jgi:mono/diheme cytochrome c family protein